MLRAARYYVSVSPYYDAISAVFAAIAAAADA